MKEKQREDWETKGERERERREEGEESGRIGKVSVQTNGGCLVVTEVVWHDDSQYPARFVRCCRKGGWGGVSGGDGRGRRRY